LVGDVMTADHDGFEKICLIAGATEDAGFRGAGDVEETAGHHWRRNLFMAPS
jgi:hypothetical protein